MQESMATVYTWKSMHDDHILLRPREDGMVHPVYILHLLPFSFICKPLLLYTRDIKHVRLPEHLFQTLTFVNMHSSFTRRRDDIRRHGKRGGRDKIEAD